MGRLQGGFPVDRQARPSGPACRAAAVSRSFPTVARDRLPSRRAPTGWRSRPIALTHDFKSRAWSPSGSSRKPSSSRSSRYDSTERSAGSTGLTRVTIRASSAYLREALAAMVAPDELKRPGLTAEERTAYAVSYVPRLRAETGGPARPSRGKDQGGPASCGGRVPRLPGSGRRLSCHL